MTMRADASVPAQREAAFSTPPAMPAAPLHQSPAPLLLPPQSVPAVPSAASASAATPHQLHPPPPPPALPPPHHAPAVPIAKLPTKRYASEKKENMNCKSCRKRKVRVGPSACVVGGARRAGQTQADARDGRSNARARGRRAMPATCSAASASTVRARAPPPPPPPLPAPPPLTAA